MAVDLASLQAKHPTWNIVSAVPAPGGGIWALGADGGVFSLDAAGNVGGTTPFWGSYQGLDPIHRQGQRKFVSIMVNADTGGYTLASATGERYDFFDPAKTPNTQTPAPAPPKAEPAPPVQDAVWESLQTTLGQWGLSGLMDWAWGRYRGLGASQDAAQVVLLEMPDQEAYKTRFPGMQYLRDQAKTGGRIWSEREYMDYEAQARQLLVSAGLPPGFYDDPTDFAKFIQGEVSIRELGERIQLAYNAANTHPEIANMLQTYYGIDRGSLTAFFLDPDRAEPFLEKQAKFATAGIGSQAKIFGGVSETEARGLQDVGVTFEQARERFGQLSQAEELLTALPGEAGQEVTRQEQMGFVAQDPAVMQALQRQSRRRQTVFEGGGGFFAEQAGITGLGRSGA